MAFVNEMMTPEEVKEFASRKIPNPGNPRFTLDPYRWTIDRNENVILLKTLQDREEPFDYYFLLLWKEIPISLRLRDAWSKEDNCSIRTWDLISIDSRVQLKEHRTEIGQSLKDALRVYGVDGNPREPFNTINKGIKVEFKF